MFDLHESTRGIHPGILQSPKTQPQQSLSETNFRGLVKSLPSLQLTYHLKMDGWNLNTSFLLENPFFRGYVSFREDISCANLKKFPQGFLCKKISHDFKLFCSVSLGLLSFCSAQQKPTCATMTGNQDLLVDGQSPTRIDM